MFRPILLAAFPILANAATPEMPREFVLLSRQSVNVACANALADMGRTMLDAENPTALSSPATQLHTLAVLYLTKLGQSASADKEIDRINLAMGSQTPEQRVQMGVYCMNQGSAELKAMSDSKRLELLSIGVKARDNAIAKRRPSATKVQ